MVVGYRLVGDTVSPTLFFSVQVFIWKRFGCTFAKVGAA